jgi:hypothetical protein
MFYKTEEIRQMLLSNPESYYAQAVNFARSVLEKKGHPAAADLNVQLTESCFYYMSTNEQGNPMVMGIPCWLYSIRPSEGVRMFASFAVWTAVEDICMIQPEIEVIGIDAENEKGEKNTSRMLFCKEDEYAAIRQILQIAPIKKGGHLSLVVDNENTVEALAESMAPSIELTQDKLIQLLRQNLSISLMPSAKATHYNHRVPRALAAKDDGDFFRQLIAMKRSGMHYRDALKRGEIYVVLVVSGDTFVVGLKSLFSIMSQNQHDYMDMGERSFIVDRRQLMQEIISL